MLCSATEILLGAQHLEGEGILGVEGVAAGADLVEALGLDDCVLELDLTPNYSPSLCMLGVAYEVAALTGGSVRVPATDAGAHKGSSARDIAVSISDPDLCGRYVAKMVYDVRVAHSPFWMQRRLVAAGIRPISNVVDVSNYVMMETGQPLHMFDYGKLKGAQIVVRRARPGETIVTLDGMSRDLSDGMLVIADAERAVGIAGVMGGLDSEVTGNTRNVLVESACFQPLSIRRTAAALLLRSEASLRFEKQVDPNGQVFAAERAARLLEEIAGGTPAPDVVDCHPVKVEPKVMMVNTDRIRTIVGARLADEEICGLLRRYGFGVTAETGGTLRVTVPTRRVDIFEEVDISEEVARLYGYDKIEPTLLRGSSRGASRPASREFASIVREAMLACGADEVSTYSMIDPEAFDRLRLPASSDLRLAAPLARPLVEEQSIMRTTLIPGLLDALKTNASHRVVDARLFEIGRVFHPKSLPMQDLPEEEEHLGVAAMGHASPPHWGERPSEAGFFFLKGLIEAVLDRIGVEARFEPVDERRTAGRVTRLEQAAHAMHPYRRAVILVDDRVAGVVGEAHPLVARDYDLPGRVALAEINLSHLLPLSLRERAFSPLPRFPAVERDVAVLAPVDVPAAEILATIRDAGGDLLKDVSLFDLYAGGQVPEGKRSLAFSLVYRAEDRTLTDEEVDRRHSEVRRALESKGLALR